MQSLRELDVDLGLLGRGGPQMKAIAGTAFNNWIGNAAVLGLWEVVKKYGYFREQFKQAIHEIAEHRPDAVVLIDYPGFNLRLAKTIRRLGLTKKLIYYISPQVWAWNRGRIKQMARYLDLMLCIFPFEADLYNKSGLRTKFVGHPMIDRLRPLKIDIRRDPNLVGLFPGSRRRELAKHFPIILDTVRELFRQNQNLRFEIAAASEDMATEISEELAEARMKKELFRVVIGETAVTMQRAAVGIVASGSATLEAAYFRLPFILIYKVAWPTYVIGRLVVRVNYLGMPNVLADRPVVPEFIQHGASPRKLADAVTRLMGDKGARKKMVLEFDAIVASLGEGGASRHAADLIMAELNLVE